MKTNFLYTISLKSWKEKKQGFFQMENEEWLLLKSLFTDYMMDGVSIIHKKYISSIQRGEKEEFEEKVLLINKKVPTDLFTIDIDNLYNILLQEDKIIQVIRQDEFRSYIGKIIKINNKSILMKLLSPSGIWLRDPINIKKENIRTIDFDTDYINSLSTYSKQRKDDI